MTDQLLKLYARRSLGRGLRLLEGLAVAEGVRGRLRVRRDARPGAGDRRRQARHAVREADGPAALRRRRATARPRSPCAPRSRPCSTASRSPLLAPTTILADQHFRTFQRRFAAFPVTIELLSRFRSRPEQKEIVAKVADGTVDILIATHRMLGKDLAFRDLGLLIVDEEQRFGVAQKEKLKEWKASIDVLAMSATPIPRSLHLSLSGLRDLSIIETPPRDRLAIETQVVPSKPEVIREAIEAEIERGGQVFFVHNRIESIGAASSRRSRSSCRRSASTVAHGQMPEAELEKAMRQLLHARGRRPPRDDDRRERPRHPVGEHDPDRPRRHLRPRAALPAARPRGPERQARLRVPPRRRRTRRSPTIARRRLASIQEFCDLGAGFRIAAKDLEIRGLGEHPRRRAVRAHRRRRLRDVPVAPRGGDPRDAGRGAAAGARRDAVARPRPRDPARTTSPTRAGG